MKKIYLLTMGLVAFVVASNAQPIGGTCPPTLRAEYMTLPLTPTACKLVIEDGPTVDPADPNQSNFPVVTMYKVGGGILQNSAGEDNTPLDASGNASISYNCATTNIDYFDIDYYVEVGGVMVLRQCQYRPAERGALPVKLTSFSGRLKTDNLVVLDWTSVIEESSFQYEVQRSVDGTYFEKVGTLKAAGTTLSTVKYTFEDQLPSTGAYFYRLKQIDIDQNFEYSKTVYVNSKKGSGVISKVFPNPFKGAIQLIGATSSDLTNNNIQVYSIGGQRINYRITGANSILIDPSAPDGIYILKMIKQNQQFRLVKSQASGTTY